MGWPGARDPIRRSSGSKVSVLLSVNLHSDPACSSPQSCAEGRSINMDGAAEERSSREDQRGDDST
ncbi:hypothetical protein EYF80_007641 [Liparis tanakae]|uniref:Uncharacterized protein n=1 Tax=Liparis tanakae TaxID=230148 RepID=A0A4Z2IVL4_9TELE|nr:hypothetical protein EYF80_007641 [Liparis tanakae]